MLHFHQPVGNFDSVIERVTERCYRPLLEMLCDFAEVKTHLHFNGILLDWFERRQPDLLDRIRELVDANSTELLTGGHQEPILGVIPQADALAQIQRLSDELSTRFGAEARGAWLTERVWEPQLPSLLARAGVRYVTLDDTILQAAGAEPKHQGSHYVTDDRGHPLTLFSADHRLRYAIPFQPKSEALSLIGPGLAVYADDAEKFGEWPQTHEWVYEKGWLRDFLTTVREEVETVHLRDELSAAAPAPRAYPPSSSYPEMTTWALPTEARLRLEQLLAADDHAEQKSPWREFARGAPWRGFFAKYPEAQRLYARMLRVSRRLNDTVDLDEDTRASIRRDLFAGQCNDAYWHGSFGGLYLVHLRRTVERHLIRAERALERSSTDSVVVQFADIDFDGREEVEIVGAGVRASVDPARGGALTAWDFRAACTNLVSAMQRHEEPFHRQLADSGAIAATESNAEGESISTIHGGLRIRDALEASDLVVDRHSRVGGLVWIAERDANWQTPLRLQDAALQLGGPWRAGIDGDVLSLCYEDGRDRIEKRYRFDADDGSLHVQIRAESERSEPWLLLTEWNLLLGYTGEDLRRADGADPDHASGSVDAVDQFAWKAGGDAALELSAAPAARLAWDVIRTVHSSEGGLERSAQGSCWVVGWEVDRSPFEAELTLRPRLPEIADGDSL